MPIKYQHKEKTDYGAKKIILKLIHHNIVVVNIGTGGGKTFMAIRSIGVINPNAHLLVITTKKQVDSQSWNESIDSYNKECNTNLSYNIINYEALKAKKKQPLIKEDLKKYKNKSLFIIADEAHKMRNPKSKNFKYIRNLTKLKNFKKLICLSATPITESLLDTQGYLILAGYYRNQTDFRKKHVVRLDKYFQPIVKDRAGVIHNEWLKNHVQIIEEFKNIQVHIDTKKLLPPVKYKEITFEFDKATQHGYRQIKKDYLNGVYDTIATANAAQRKYVAEHDNKRQKMLKRIIDNPKRPKGPILIFYQYNSERDQLRKFVKKYYNNFHIYEINGVSKDKIKETPPNNSIFICQYIAASEALNAQWSHLSVFYAPTYSWEKYKQAQGRNVRAFQDGTTYHFRFVVRKTINQHYWYDLIDNKKTFTTDLMKSYLTNND